jgi:hypothetical protein
VSLVETGRPVAARHEADAYSRLVESLPIPGLRWRAVAVRGTMAGLDGRLDEARRHSDELRRVGATDAHAAATWALFEIAFAVCTGIDRLRDADRDVTSILAPRIMLRPWMACVDAMLGRKEEARSRLRPTEITRHLPEILVSAQAAVLLESAELAEAYYARLAEVAPVGRFFWGPADIFPFGPTSRILGELARLRGRRGPRRRFVELEARGLARQRVTSLAAGAVNGGSRTGQRPRPRRRQHRNRCSRRWTSPPARCIRSRCPSQRRRHTRS